MITNNSKQELKTRVDELQGKLKLLDDEQAKLQAQIDFIKTRKTDLKARMDDMRLDSA